jgi:hypothetical protein
MTDLRSISCETERLPVIHRHMSQEVARMIGNSMVAASVLPHKRPFRSRGALGQKETPVTLLPTSIPHGFSPAITSIRRSLINLNRLMPIRSSTYSREN